MVDAQLLAHVLLEGCHPVVILDGIAGEDQRLAVRPEDLQQRRPVAFADGLLQRGGCFLGRGESLLSRSGGDRGGGGVFGHRSCWCGGGMGAATMAPDRARKQDRQGGATDVGMQIESNHGKLLCVTFMAYRVSIDRFIDDRRRGPRRRRRLVRLRRHFALARLPRLRGFRCRAGCREQRLRRADCR